MFGRLHCTAGDREISGLEARKVQELLIHLLLHRTHPTTREALATLLWGERNDAQARKYLRQALWQLQRALDAACHPLTPLLRADADWIEFDPALAIWLDVEQFERAYTATQRVDGGALSAAQAELLCQAVQLYQGDLLEGWYQDWCIAERERFQQMYLAMLDKLIACAEQHGDHALGIYYGELSLRCDPARERTHRRLMRLHCIAGNRTAALRQYESCVDMLRRELGVEPAKSTHALYEQICRDQFAASDSPAPSPVTSAAPPAVEVGELADLLAHLGQMQTTLLQTLQQVQRDIDRVEALIHRVTADVALAAPPKPAPFAMQELPFPPRPPHPQLA
jgi:DNA-binding SARP family transcriptional activator